MSQRILLLGADGLLGNALARAIQRRGLAADCLDRSGCDVTNAQNVSAVFDRVRPEVVINCTAYTKVDLAEKQTDQALAVNATAVANIATACREHWARLVHISTDFVFDGKANRPYQPEDLVSPLSAYGESKLQGEALLRVLDPPSWMIARTSWLFGATGPCFAKMVVDRSGRGEPLKIVNDQVGSPTYAPDLANAILEMLDQRVSGIHHVTNRGQCSWFEFAVAIAREFGLKSEISAITTAEFRQMRPGQAVRPAFSVMEDRELPGLLGREMRPWQEALADFRSESILR